MISVFETVFVVGLAIGAIFFLIVLYLVASNAMRKRRAAREIPTCYGYGPACDACRACLLIGGTFNGPTVREVLTVNYKKGV